jgi:hypothetical protein
VPESIPTKQHTELTTKRAALEKERDSLLRRGGDANDKEMKKHVEASKLFNREVGSEVNKLINGVNEQIASIASQLEYIEQNAKHPLQTPESQPNGENLQGYISDEMRQKLNEILEKDKENRTEAEYYLFMAWEQLRKCEAILEDPVKYKDEEIGKMLAQVNIEDANNNIKKATTILQRQMNYVKWSERALGKYKQDLVQISSEEMDKDINDLIKENGSQYAADYKKDPRTGKLVLDKNGKEIVTQTYCNRFVRDYVRKRYKYFGFDGYKDMPLLANGMVWLMRSGVDGWTPIHDPEKNTDLQDGFKEAQQRAQEGYLVIVGIERGGPTEGDSNSGHVAIVRKDPLVPQGEEQKWAGWLLPHVAHAGTHPDANSDITLNLAFGPINKDILVIYYRGYTLTTTATNGSVSKTPDKSSYNYGESVTLTAIADEGYCFSNWSGDASGTDNPTTIAMTGGKFVTAIFYYNPEAYNLVVNASQGSVSKTPDKSSYSPRETVTLQATPNKGYGFVKWTGDVNDTNNPTKITMNSHKLVTANFAIYKLKHV